MAVWADLGRSATRIGHVPVVVTQRLSARYRHWSFRCCSSPDRDLDQVLVAWFTDDAGFRSQLDEYQHLVQSDDETTYLPPRTPLPLPQARPKRPAPPRPRLPPRRR